MLSPPNATLEWGLWGLSGLPVVSSSTSGIFDLRAQCRTVPEQSVGLAIQQRPTRARHRQDAHRRSIAALGPLCQRASLRWQTRMLRLRFSSGLILGLVVGLIAGVLMGIFMLPTRGSDPGAATSLQVIELTRKLEAAKDDKERTDRQLEEFQKLSEQMTATFKSLEQRFNALEESQRQHDGQPPAGQPAPKPLAADAKAPAPEAKAPPPEPTVATTPTAAPSASGERPGEPAGGDPDDSLTTGG